MLTDAVARPLAKLIRASSRHPRAVLAVLLVGTLVLGAGATQFTFHNRFTEWVPDTNEDKAAFDRALTAVPGTVNYEVVWLELDPDKTDETNITSPEALRAQEEFARYVRERVPEAAGVNGPVYWVKLANYAHHGNDPRYFRLPDDPVRMEAARQAALDANRDAILHFTARDWSGALVTFPIAEDPLTPEANDAGLAVRDATEAYLQEDDLDHDLFREAYVVPVGVPSSSGVMDEIARSTILEVAPWAVLVIVGALLWGLRRPGATVLSLATVATSTLWVLGVAGWSGQALNLFNLAIFPLILGNGIDYSIHVLHEAHRGDGDGLDADHLARSVGVPIVFVTTTTVLGLAAMTFSGSTYLTELGAWASGAMVVTALASLTLLPAAVSLRPSLLPDEPRSAPWLGRAARWARRHRGPMILVLLVVSVLAAWSATHGTYSVALMEDSFPEGDPAVQAKHRFEAKTEGGDVAFVLYEGNVTSPASRAFMDRVVEELVAGDVVADSAAVNDLPLLLQGYESVESDPGGTDPILPGSPGGTDDGDRGSDMTDAQARAALRDMYASPIWNPTARGIVSPDLDHTVGYVLPQRTDDTLAAADAQRTAIEDAVAAAGPAPDDLDVHVYGFKVMAHDFLEFSITWLWVLFLLTFTSTVALVWVLLRDPKAVAAVTGPMVLSGLWWLGLLPLFGISITIYLFVAVLFITSIGSDYAAYLVWKARETGDLATAWSTTGRAVLFAAVTDGAAFLVFSGVRIPSARDMMLAASLAIACILAATALYLPLFMDEGLLAADAPDPATGDASTAAP